MSRACKVCGARLPNTTGRTGRPRTYCSRCRPVGAPEPSGKVRSILRARRARERAGTAARGAAARAVAKAHPDEYRAELARERLQRGLA